MLEGHTLRLTGGVFCNSAYTESLVQQRARRTWRVPNPIRSAFFQQPTGMPDSDVPCLLNVGLVTPRKRQLELLQSLRRLRNAGHTFKIIFVGGHSENSEYGKRFGAELKAAEKEGSAEYAGYLDVEELVPLMDRCSGFIHFPMEEAFGLVVAEAMARGLKFFGADLGGIRDIAAGIPGAELHDTMEELQGGIASWLRAGAPRFPDAAREMRNRYHPQVIAARHVEIYREMLER
jgi:glycosyltransferase involved in cell wall biosynthesis